MNHSAHGFGIASRLIALLLGLLSGGAAIKTGGVVLAGPPADDASRFGLMEVAGLQWLHLSSHNGDLPPPGQATQQTGCVVADLDRDGVNEIVLSFRKQAPALVWYRRTVNGWDRYVIEKE